MVSAGPLRRMVYSPKRSTLAGKDRSVAVMVFHFSEIDSCQNEDEGEEVSQQEGLAVVEPPEEGYDGYEIADRGGEDGIGPFQQAEKGYACPEGADEREEEECS